MYTCYRPTRAQAARVQDLDVRSHPGVCRGLAKLGLWPPARTSKRSQKTQPKLWKQPRNDGRVRSEYLISMLRKSSSCSLRCIYCPVCTSKPILWPVHPHNLCVSPDTGRAGQERHLCSCRANDEGQYNSSLHCRKQHEGLHRVQQQFVYSQCVLH